MADSVMKVVLDEMWKYGPQCCGSGVNGCAAEALSSLEVIEEDPKKNDGCGGPDKQADVQQGDGEKVQATSGDFVNDSMRQMKEVYRQSTLQVDERALSVEVPTAAEEPADEVRSPNNSSAPREGYEARENAYSADEFIPGNDERIDDNTKAGEPSVGIEEEVKEYKEGNHTTGEKKPSIEEEGKEQEAVELTWLATDLSSEKTASATAGKDMNMSAPSSPPIQNMPLTEISSEDLKDDFDGCGEIPIENLSSLAYSLGDGYDKYVPEEDSGFGLIPEGETRNNPLRTITSHTSHTAGTSLPPKGPRSMELLTNQKGGLSMLPKGRAESPNASASDVDAKVGGTGRLLPSNQVSSKETNQVRYSTSNSSSAPSKSIDLAKSHGEVIGLSALDVQRGEGYISSCTLSQSCKDTGLASLFVNVNAPPTSPTTTCRTLSPNSQDRQSYFSPTHSSNPSYISSSSSEEDEIGAILENVSSLSHKGSELSDQAAGSPWISHDDALYSITDDSNIGVAAASKNRGDDTAQIQPPWSSSSPAVLGLDDSIDSILMASSSSFDGGDSLFDGKVSKDSDQFMKLSEPLRSALDELKILGDDSYECDTADAKSKYIRSTSSKGRELVKAAEEAISRFSAATSSTEIGTSKHEIGDDVVHDDRELAGSVEAGTSHLERKGKKNKIIKPGDNECKKSKQEEIPEASPSCSGDDVAKTPPLNGVTIENVACDLDESSPYMLEACKDVPVEIENKLPTKTEMKNTHRRVVSCDGRDMKIISLRLQSDSQIDSIFRSASSKSPSSSRSQPGTEWKDVGRKDYPTRNVSALEQEGTNTGNGMLIDPGPKDSVFRDDSSHVSPRERSLSEPDLSGGGVSATAQLEHDMQQHYDVTDGGSVLRFTRKSVSISQTIPLVGGLSANEEQRIKSLPDLSANEEHIEPFNHISAEREQGNIQVENTKQKKLAQEEYQERVTAIRRHYNSKLEQLQREMDHEIQRQSALLKQAIPEEAVIYNTVLGSSDERYGFQKDSTYLDKGSLVQETDENGRDGLPVSQEKTLHSEISETKTRKNAIEEKLNNLLKNADHESDGTNDHMISTQNSFKSDASETKRLRKDAMEKRLSTLLKRIHSPKADTSNTAADSSTSAFFGSWNDADDKERSPEETSVDGPRLRSQESSVIEHHELRCLPQSSDETPSGDAPVAIDRLNVSDVDQSQTNAERVKRIERQYFEEISSLEEELNTKLQDEGQSLQNCYRNMTAVHLHKEDGADGAAERAKSLEGQTQSNRESHEEEMKKMRINHEAEIGAIAEKIVKIKSDYETRFSDVQARRTKRDESILALNARIADANRREKAIKDHSPEIMKSLEAAKTEFIDTKDKVQALTKLMKQMKVENQKQLQDEPAKLRICCNRMKDDITAAIDRQYTEGNKKLEALQKEHDEMLDRMDALKKLHGIKQSSGNTIKEEGEQRQQILLAQLEELKEVLSAAEEKSCRQKNSFVETTVGMKESIHGHESAISDMKQYAGETETHKNEALAEAAELRMENAELEKWCRELMSILSSAENEEHS